MIQDGFISIVSNSIGHGVSMILVRKMLHSRPGMGFYGGIEHFQSTLS